MGKTIDDLNPILSKITRQVAAIKSSRFALFIDRGDADASVLRRGSLNDGYFVIGVCGVHKIEIIDNILLPFNTKTALR